MEKPKKNSLIESASDSDSKERCSEIQKYRKIVTLLAMVSLSSCDWGGESDIQPFVPLTDAEIEEQLKDTKRFPPVKQVRFSDKPKKKGRNVPKNREELKNNGDKKPPKIREKSPAKDLFRQRHPRARRQKVAFA